MLDSQKQANKAITFSPVETKRASEVIYEQIVDMIVTGKLKEGDRLPSEKNMMDMTRRSRPTVREALRMLERAGYIRTISGSNGAIIQKPSVLSVVERMEHLLMCKSVSSEEMAEYREINETQTARWAALRRTQEDIDAMKALLDKAETLVADYDAFIGLDPEFHILVAKAAKNKVSRIMTAVLNGSIIQTVRHQQNTMSEEGRIAMNEKVLWMHRCILEAIASGDPDEAEKAMLFHMKALQKDLIWDKAKDQSQPADSGTP